MAENSPIPVGEHRRDPTSLIAQVAVADGVNPAMKREQPAGSSAAVNPRAREAGGAQLGAGDDPVLAARNPGDQGVRVRFVSLVPHVRNKGDKCPDLAPFIRRVFVPARPGRGRFRYRAAAVATERTLILVKPDAFERGLTGEVIARFERKGLRLVALKLMQATEEIANVHYEEHTDKPFFGELVEFITSGPTWALVVEGEGAIATLRMTIGATVPANAAPGTIRGDLASSMPDNLVHGSDSPEAAEREIALWFGA